MISLSLPGSTAAPVLRDCWPDFVRGIDSASPRSARALRGYGEVSRARLCEVVLVVEIR